MDIVNSRFLGSIMVNIKAAQEHAFVFERISLMPGQDRRFLLTDMQMSEVEHYAKQRADIAGDQLKYPPALQAAKAARKEDYDKMDPPDWQFPAA